jgi:hypothetical protein
MRRAITNHRGFGLQSIVIYFDCVSHEDPSLVNSILQVFTDTMGSAEIIAFTFINQAAVWERGWLLRRPRTAITLQ